MVGVVVTLPPCRSANLETVKDLIQSAFHDLGLATASSRRK
jgi:hypothetical protein